MIFFVNVSPNLAKEISVPGGNDDKVSSISCKCNSVFLGGVCESDIEEVMSKFKSKKIHGLWWPWHVANYRSKEEVKVILK